MPDLEILVDGEGQKYIIHDGHKRILNARWKPAGRMYGFPAFSSKFSVLPRSQWYNKSLSGFSLFRKDQDGRGACVGHGSVTALEISRAAAGFFPVELSAWFTYSDIDGGSDNGANVEDALTSLKTKGSCLNGSVPYLTYRESQISSQATAEAQRFKVDEAIDCTTFDDLVSAILTLDSAVSFGIDIGNAFDPGSDGICPSLRGGGGGHCMCGKGVINIGGKWYIEVQNSWGTSWGKGGDCFMDESYFSGQSGHWAIIAAAADPLDPNKPPVVSV